MKELEVEELRNKTNQQSTSKEFDLARSSRLVPPFNEKEVDDYFTLFERVADRGDYGYLFLSLHKSENTVNGHPSKFIFAIFFGIKCSINQAMNDI